MDKVNSSCSSPEQQAESDSSTERYAPPRRRRTSALQWAEDCNEYEQQRQTEATRKQRETRARNAAKRRTPRRTKLPAVVKPVRFYVPPRLSHDWFDEHHWWRACYVVSTIHLHWVWKWKWRHCKGRPGYVNLVYRYLTNVIGRKEWKFIKKTLLVHQVIECDKDAVPKRKAYGFRLTEEFRDDLHLQTCTDSKFSRRMVHVYAKDRQHLQPEHHGLRDWLDHVGIDAAGAREAVLRLRLKKKKRKVGEGQQPYTLQTYHEDQSHCVQVIADREHFLVVNKYGRVTTSITQLKRELVPYLFFDLKAGQEPVVWADVSACQPLLSVLMAQKYHNSSRSSLSRLLKRKYNRENPYRAADRSLPHSLLSLTKEKEGGEGKGREESLYGSKTSLTSYDSTDLQGGVPVTPAPAEEDSDLSVLLEAQRLCEEGRFYQNFMTTEERARKGYLPRFKVRFLAMMYAETNRRHPNALRPRFAKRFPPWADFMETLRRKHYRRAAWLMHNTEATLFIHRICGRILRERPDVPLVTKHDALGTSPQHIAYVCRVIQEEFALLGSNPTVKVTGAGLTPIIRAGFRSV